jgi:hypothetical protein
MSGYISGQNVSAAKSGAAQYMLWDYDQEAFARVVYDACQAIPDARVIGVIDSLIETRL